jgi:hypothetical protein
LCVQKSYARIATGDQSLALQEDVPHKARGGQQYWDVDAGARADICRQFNISRPTLYWLVARRVACIWLMTGANAIRPVLPASFVSSANSTSLLLSAVKALEASFFERLAACR